MKKRLHKMDISKFYKQLKENKRCKKFADECGISAAHLCLLGSYKRRPSPQLAQKIEEKSLGMLDKVDLLYPERR